MASFKEKKKQEEEPQEKHPHFEKNMKHAKAVYENSLGKMPEGMSVTLSDSCVFVSATPPMKAKDPRVSRPAKFNLPFEVYRKEFQDAFNGAWEYCTQKCFEWDACANENGSKTNVNGPRNEKLKMVKDNIAMRAENRL